MARVMTKEKYTEEMIEAFKEFLALKFLESLRRVKTETEGKAIND